MEAQRSHGGPPESEGDSGGSSYSDSMGSSSEEETGRPSQSINEPYARWTATYDIALANAMVQQILQGKTTKNGFSKKAWAGIRTEFNKKTGCCYTQQQIRNRKGVLKMQYRIVKQLLGHPGFKWDETRHMVIAEDAVWNDYVKVTKLNANPEAEKFRTLHFPAYDQLSIISGDVGAKLRLPKSSQQPSLDASTPDVTPQFAQEQADTDEPSGALLDSAYLARNPDNIQRCNKRQSITLSGSSHRRKKESNSSDLTEAFFEFADALRCKTQASAPSGDPYAMSKCIKELESIKGVTDEDVFGGVDLFRDPLLREAFMAMQPHRRLRWIRTRLNLVPCDS